MMNEKYPFSVSPVWWSKTRKTLQSMTVTEENFDQLKTALKEAYNRLELGGKIQIQFLAEDSRKNEKSPHAYLQLMSKKQAMEQANFRSGPVAPKADDDVDF